MLIGQIEMKLLTFFQFSFYSASRTTKSNFYRMQCRTYGKKENVLLETLNHRFKITGLR